MSQLEQKVSEPQNSLCKFGLFYFNKHRWALKILGVQGSSSTSNSNDHTYLSQRDTVADYTKQFASLPHASIFKEKVLFDKVRFTTMNHIHSCSFCSSIHSKCFQSQLQLSRRATCTVAETSFRDRANTHRKSWHIIQGNKLKKVQQDAQSSTPRTELGSPQMHGGLAVPTVVPRALGSEGQEL